MFSGPFNGFNSQKELDEFLQKLPEIEFAARTGRELAKSHKKRAQFVWEAVLSLNEDSSESRTALNEAISYCLDAYSMDHFLDIVSITWRDYKQSEVAKRPRPKKGLTRKGETIAAMRNWANGEQHRTLRGFLQASNGSIESLCVELADIKGVERYIITLQSDVAPENTETVSFRTLEDWWTASRKRSTTD